MSKLVSSCPNMAIQEAEEDEIDPDIKNAVSWQLLVYTSTAIYDINNLGESMGFPWIIIYDKCMFKLLILFIENFEISY